MEMTVENLNDSVKAITLKGRMDFSGTQEIDIKFTGHTASSSQNIIVDMSGVDFVASIGIRTLVSNAKALKQKGKKMVLVGLQDNVFKVLDMAGITGIISSFKTIDEAVKSFES